MPDVMFLEDLARFRTGDGQQNMAINRHTAGNLHARIKPPVSLTNLHKRAGRNIGNLETVTRQTARRASDLSAVQDSRVANHLGRRSGSLDAFHDLWSLRATTPTPVRSWLSSRSGQNVPGLATGPRSIDQPEHMVQPRSAWDPAPNMANVRRGLTCNRCRRRAQ
jgi:hypothetical protein